MYKVVHKSRRQLVAALASSTLVASLVAVSAAPAQATETNSKVPREPAKRSGCSAYGRR